MHGGFTFDAVKLDRAGIMGPRRSGGYYLDSWYGAVPEMSSMSYISGLTVSLAPVSRT